MTRFKKFLILIAFLQLYIILTPLPALAYNTYHVAVVPLVNTANCQDEEILELIQTKVKNKFKFPFYEIMSVESTAGAVQKDTLKNLKDKAAMEQLANDLSADIVIGIELVDAQSATVTSSFWGLYSDDDDTYLDTRVLIKCYAYTVKDGTYLSLRASSSGLEPMRVDTNLYNSVGKAMDELIGKLPYKRVPADALTLKGE
ncbi:MULTISPECIES: hypothetical protein [Pelosinus]|uniref:Uncharacterized protein n=1 Tax=Pelosinus fermentans B4 TaxID=1149862 RepID=I8RJK8_9FIRM|nr:MULTISPECIES: hypothetical protein [Pelosinus]EIW20233.1 hypothetical protein FB4_2399 [Pelosinus fermentans B4]EIW25929.1 hypothetical protein FA11_2128 [Pelosinus fermentans A11]OAM93227.1 hypothetical protein FR7_01243 [Pelosinus fermentans DSM 17108]SDQ70937.1 hypothetical protein SAMN04515679_1308 [Pelosinus fermentans]